MCLIVFRVRNIGANYARVPYSVHVGVYSQLKLFHSQTNRLLLQFFTRHVYANINNQVRKNITQVVTSVTDNTSVYRFKVTNDMQLLTL